jgi:hypothetical protein
MSAAISAWGYEERGENLKGRGQETMISSQTAERILSLKDGPEGLAMLVKLSHAHGSRKEPFAIQAEAMARHRVIPSFGRTKRPYERGRRILLEVGELKQIHRGRCKGDPSLFVLTRTRA